LLERAKWVGGLGLFTEWRRLGFGIEVGGFLSVVVLILQLVGGKGGLGLLLLEGL